MTEKTGKSSTEKLQQLRDHMQKSGVDVYLVPRADEWQGEYVPARAERLSWLSGFTGSAGMALVEKSKAAVFSDSRYTEQMKVELDPALFEAVEYSRAYKMSDWMAEHLPEGVRIGYDPRLHTVSEIKALEKALEEKQITLVPVDGNLVDAVWDDQPEHPDDKVVVYPEAYAGQASGDKRLEIATEISEAGADAVLLTTPESIAWLLNVRGNDVPHVPVPLSYALLHKDGSVDWFVPPEKVRDEVRRHIGAHIQIHAFEDMADRLQALAQRKAGIMIDESQTAIWFQTLLQDGGANIIAAPDPVVPRKAIKNETEQKYIREAHVKDGVALVKFWKWIDEHAENGGITELDAVAKLRGYREQQDGFQDCSFDAIVGWADHGAVVHYRADEKQNKTITSGSLLLVDSGGQYLGGTTDNTRTRAIGTPSSHMKEMFTRVLKGHIAVADGKFPEGTTGRDVDFLAHQFLRKAIKDFGHGTGHGVGSYLSVHEDGAGLYGDIRLKPGMLISNEPGYYEAGAFGIRIENLVFVAETGDKALKYQFNTVSLTPIDQKLIDLDLLDKDEINWLNAYHKDVYEKLSPHLDTEEKAWLKKETAPIHKP
ncbi:MAG: aminopeptidase P family protein [Rhodospirillales bacterium]|nr:aminopeptidase P family protein [Rhodospirillales bacterium]MCB9996372.1 aminopeptidase P family protein [Rhodospirillales bacterium]